MRTLPQVPLASPPSRSPPRPSGTMIPRPEATRSRFLLSEANDERRLPSRAAAVTSCAGAVPAGSCSRVGGAPPPAGCGHARRFRFPLRLLPPPPRWVPPPPSQRRRVAAAPRSAPPFPPSPPGESAPACRSRLSGVRWACGRAPGGGSPLDGASGNAGPLIPAASGTQGLAGPRAPRFVRFQEGGGARLELGPGFLRASVGPASAPPPPGPPYLRGDTVAWGGGGEVIS